jgi:hypothetical protein
MVGIENAFAEFVKRISHQEKSKAEEPLSKYKSYSENELLSNLDAKMPNLQIEDDAYYAMPKYYPMDVLPPSSVPVMPQIMNRDRQYMDLARGGVASMFRKRKRYADGGFITMKDNGDFVVTYPSGSPSLYSGTANAEFLQNLISQGYSYSGQQGSTGMSTPTTTEIPTVDPFSSQPVSEQEIIDLNRQMNPPTPAAGYTEEGLRKIAEDDAARLQSMMEAL